MGSLSWRQLHSPPALPGAAEGSSDDASERETAYALYSLAQGSLLAHNDDSCLARVSAQHGLEVRCLAWNASGVLAATGHSGGLLCVVDVSSHDGPRIARHTATAGMDCSAVVCVRWLDADLSAMALVDETCALLAVGCQGGAIRIYEFDAG